MLFSLGCIQALRCHTNTCPTGITTQDRARKSALHVHERGPMVASFHEKTIESFLHLGGALGVEHASELVPDMIMRRLENEKSVPYSELYHEVVPGELLEKTGCSTYAKPWQEARADAF